MEVYEKLTNADGFLLSNVNQLQESYTEVDLLAAIHFGKKDWVRESHY